MTMVEDVLLAIAARFSLAEQAVDETDPIFIRPLPVVEFPWPPGARTIDEAHKLGWPNTKLMTRAEFETLYSSETP